MKEYVVLAIKCKMEVRLFDVYSVVRSSVSYNRNLFAIQDLKLEKLSKKSYDLYESLNLDKYKHIFVLEHLLNTSYYNPEQHDIRMISNLDKCWRWSNENTSDSLCNDDFSNLIDFCDSLKKNDVSTLILGFDQIKWGEGKVDKGTYGFEKADCSYGLGRNYLSNSVIVGRTNENKPYTVYISCERHFRNLNIIEKIASSLGKVICEEVYFAPENDDEREEWIQKAKFAELKFRTAISGLQNLAFEKTKKTCAIYDVHSTFNINSYIKKYLCKNGWKTRTARSNERPSIIYKNKDDKEIAFSIVSSHNGQYLQVLIYYSSIEFLFSENLIDLIACVTSEEDIDSIFGNIVKARDYFYDLL